MFEYTTTCRYIGNSQLIINFFILKLLQPNALGVPVAYNNFWHIKMRL